MKQTWPRESEITEIIRNFVFMIVNDSKQRYLNEATVSTTSGLPNINIGKTENNSHTTMMHRLSAKQEI